MEQEPKNNLSQAIEKFTCFLNDKSETTEQRNNRISQFLEKPDTPKRLKMEINELLKQEKSGD